jgi:hypothetical protein
VISLLLLPAMSLFRREPRPRITATLVKRVAMWGNPEQGLIFSVSNSMSKTIEVEIGLRPPRLDYPRGNWAILLANEATNLRVDASQVPPPWTIRIVSRRIPGSLETKARAFGARFHLCEPRDKPTLEAEMIIKE